MDFLQHEVVILAALDQRVIHRRGHARPVHPVAAHIADIKTVPGEDDPVAFFKVGHIPSQRRQRDRIGAEIHLALAVPQHQRRALARPDHQVRLAGKDRGNREGAGEVRQRVGKRGHLVHAFAHVLRDQLGDHFGIGLGLEHAALGFQALAQLAVILDDAVVHDRHAVCHVRVGIGLVRRAVRCPAGVGNAGEAFHRIIAEARLQVMDLALGPAPLDPLVPGDRDARAVIAAILEPLQPIHQPASHLRLACNRHDTAHEPELRVARPPSECVRP